MKIRGSVLTLVTIAVLLTWLLVTHEGKRPAAPPTVAIESSPNSLPNDAAHPASISNRPTLGNPAFQPTAPGVVNETKEQKEQQMLSAYNDVPIDFYGKLVDQFGNPVAGAAVKGSIRVNNGESQTTVWLHTLSAPNGRFELHGKGQDISAVPTKEGYALASRSGGGNYSKLFPEESRIHPDPGNPIVIKMWKLQGAEPLVEINQKYRTAYTPQPIHIDLIAGKIVADGGDITISVKRPEGVISGRNEQDWGLEIEAPSGGLQDSEGSEAITYAAPETGYEPAATFTMSVASNTWYQAVHQGFFFTSRGAQIYGELNLSFHINSDPQDPITFSLTGFANTNSSRNFEGNPDTLRGAGQ